MLYPLKFRPILKNKIWGGTKLITLLNKAGVDTRLGESWELSAHEGDESVITNGTLAGKSLTELLEHYGEEVLGKTLYKKYNQSFPLLLKFIDADENLSIQVHPGDEVATERHNSFGKTEMWYVVDAEPDAKLIIGFKKDCSKEEYLAALENEKIEGLLNVIPAHKGDVFFIPSGMVHAICKGIVVAEIQQSSDITYRIYDYKRTDDQGNERELHTAEAMDVINFSASANSKINYKKTLNKVTPLVNCEYFSTGLLQFNSLVECNYSETDSFVALLCIDGSFNIEHGEDTTNVVKGETVLIPACINKITLIPNNNVTLLEISAS